MLTANNSIYTYIYTYIYILYFGSMLWKYLTFAFMSHPNFSWSTLYPLAGEIRIRGWICWRRRRSKSSSCCLQGCNRTCVEHLWPIVIKWGYFAISKAQVTPSPISASGASWVGNVCICTENWYKCHWSFFNIRWNILTGANSYH